MNIFLIHSCPFVSANRLIANDPIRARKQLLEGAQILASVDHLAFGHTYLRRKDGQPYGKAHPHHPITKLAANLGAMYQLTVDVTLALATFLPEHAVSRSLLDGEWEPAKSNSTPPQLVVCRAGQTPFLTEYRQEYAAMMLAYLQERKGFPTLD